MWAGPSLQEEMTWMGKVTTVVFTKPLVPEQVLFFKAGRRSVWDTRGKPSQLPPRGVGGQRVF